jgi:hypothetical protein
VCSNTGGGDGHGEGAVHILLIQIFERGPPIIRKHPTETPGGLDIGGPCIKQACASLGVLSLYSLLKHSTARCVGAQAIEPKACTGGHNA